MFELGGMSLEKGIRSCNAQLAHIKVIMILRRTLVTICPSFNGLCFSCHDVTESRASPPEPANQYAAYRDRPSIQQTMFHSSCSIAEVVITSDAGASERSNSAANGSSNILTVHAHLWGCAR